MPFVLHLLGDRDGEQLYSIEVGDVDHKHDRIAIVDEDEITALFLLDEVDGVTLLRVDRENSDASFLEAIEESLRDGAGVDNPDEINVWLFTGVLDTGELMLEVPPTFAIKIDGKWLCEEQDDEDEEDESKGMFRVESRTI